MADIKSVSVDVLHGRAGEEGFFPCDLDHFRMAAKEYTPSFEVGIVPQGNFVYPSTGELGRDVHTRKAGEVAKDGKATFQFTKFVDQVKAMLFAATVVKPNRPAMGLVQGIAKDSIQRCQSITWVGWFSPVI